MINLSDLEGRWRVNRVIEDERAGLTGRFEGVSVWTPERDGLLQSEDGILTYGGAAPMKATRRYHWAEIDGALHVFFDDGRPFHVVPQDGAEAVHDCPPDIYRVTYRFRGAGFDTCWRVTGPRKNMVLTSTFARV
ncbi:DUF6314 family protein [Hasllibacter sp. MH4015]|uniref:DUF6314 family protein n=1 Tax=Hasllibacter sp. MH4015 TaxID=2854029 RepID=UPI001CD7C59D|nr:DUF6314 family protein [Hasllibacter sp. MH4015]